MISSNNLHWAAGFIDGEGYFGRTGAKTNDKGCARMNAAQKDRWHLEKLQAMFGGTIKRVSKGKTGDALRIYTWEIYGRRAIAIMMTLYVLMSPRRQERIREVIAWWKTKAFVNIGRYNRDKTHCKRGHEFTPENTYAKDGKYRQCRTCQRANASRWYHAQTAGA